MNDIRCIVLRSDSEFTSRRFDPRLKTVYQNHASGRGRGGGEQQRVITPRANATRRAGCKTAEAVGFEPFFRLEIRDFRLLIHYNGGSRASLRLRLRDEVSR